MSVRTRTPEEIESATAALRAIIGRSTVIHTRTEFGRGELDYVRLYVVSRRPDDVAHIVDVTYYAAVVISAQTTAARSGAIVRRGGQYNKGLDTAESVWSAVFGTRATFDQRANWEEIK